jgi:peptide/nickel transport system permease protein
VDVEMVIRGQVYGLFGTDNLRRDIRVELLWGLPIVLAFGILGAVMTNILSMLIAAIGAWFGGGLDNLIQRITEVNMALPAFPISLLIFIMYSKSIWVILIVTVALSIFGPGIKSYRSTFLEIRESPFIEAALAYGANDWRLIFRYMVPKISSILIPRIVVAIPSFVFLEASLAYLGVSDPVFPTWGKLILDTVFMKRGSTYSLSPENMLFYSHIYFSILIPVAVLILLAVSSNALGSNLEKYLNPKLRDS